LYELINQEDSIVEYQLNYGLLIAQYSDSEGDPVTSDYVDLFTDMYMTGWESGEILESHDFDFSGMYSVYSRQSLVYDGTDAFMECASIPDDNGVYVIALMYAKEKQDSFSNLMDDILISASLSVQEQPDAVPETPPTEEETVQVPDTVTLTPGTYIVGEDLPAGKYDMECVSGLGTVDLYKDYETRMTKDYDTIETYLMTTEAYFDAVDIPGYDMSTLKSLYTFSVKNVRLADGNCIYVDTITVDLIPIQ